VSATPEQINSYLKKKGSPMAGSGATIVAAAKKYGVDPALIVGISGIESSFGKHIYGAHNAWGWGPGKPFGSWEEGITTVAKGLKKGYLSRGLTDPYKIVTRYAPASDGNDEQHWADTVSQFMGELGSPVTRKSTRQTALASTAAEPPTSRAPYVPTSQGIRSAALQNLNQIASGRPVDMVSQLQALAQGSAIDRELEIAYGNTQGVDLHPTNPTPGPTPTAEGGFLQLPTKWKSTHVTDGLSKEGFTHAVDIMGKPGTRLGSPVDGKVKYFHPTGAQGGGSMEIEGDDGRTYWLGHIADGIPAGTRVERGQIVADISADHPRPHVHIDYAPR
jgi:hypothetical protein